MATDFLLMIGEREPLAWILSQGTMAFATHRSREARQLVEGDRLFLYTTRGCFHNPGKDQGRVIGEAMVRTAVKLLDQPVEFGGGSIPIGLLPGNQRPHVVPGQCCLAWSMS